MSRKIIMLILLLLPVIGMGAKKMAETDPDEYRERQELLIKTRLGSSMEQVMVYCVDSNLKCKRSDNVGYHNGRTGEFVGVKAIRTRLYERSDHPMMRTSIVAYWGFDKDEKLIDIFVWKTIDAP